MVPLLQVSRNTVSVANSLSLLSQVYRAQTKNSALAGPSLSAVAQHVVDQSQRGEWYLLAVDRTGERIIGAALSLDSDLKTVDTSARLDGLHVLLVAGYVAGNVAIDFKIELAIRLGATQVRPVFLTDDVDSNTSSLCL